MIRSPTELALFRRMIRDTGTDTDVNDDPDELCVPWRGELVVCNSACRTQPTSIENGCFEYADTARHMVSLLIQSPIVLIHNRGEKQLGRQRDPTERTLL